MLSSHLGNTGNILIAPLDWGLGHATRCMPLIDMLLRKGKRVVIAGNGDSLYLLKEQYPNLTYYELPGYNITYPSGRNASFHALLQTPKILRTIQAENKMTAEIAAREKIGLIISDNRYGVRHHDVKSIFICHQVALQAPTPFQWMNPVFLRLHLQQIKRFDALWIPDEESNSNLSGKLSHGISFPLPAKYIGIQSRFSGYIKQASFIDDLDFDVLAVLSGPEPQRSELEKKLTKQLRALPLKSVLVQGKTAQQTITQDGPLTVISYLNTNDLFSALQKAGAIICRSGYSTVMDLAVLGKKAILIPAEGQTEQEFLAQSLSATGQAVACSQSALSVKEALTQLEHADGFTLFMPDLTLLEKALADYL